MDDKGKPPGPFGQPQAPGAWDKGKPADPFQDQSFGSPSSQPAPVGYRQTNKPGSAGRTVGAIVLLLICGGIGAAVYFFYFQKDNVAVVNGLDIPVTVSFVQSEGAEGTGAAVAEGTGSTESDPAPFEVPAGGHFVTRLSNGTYTAEVRNGDQILQVETFEVGSDASLSVINVLGAAPIYLHEVIYTTGVTPPNANWMENTYMNRRFVAVTENIDHLFEEPPEEIEISGTSETRWFFGFIPPTTAPLEVVSGTHMFEECQSNPTQPGCGVRGAGHWTISVSWLQYWGRTLEAQQLVRVVAQVDPDNQEVARWSQSLGMTLPNVNPLTTPNALPSDGIAPFRPDLTAPGAEEDK